jgi:hypothetical protein
MLALDVFIVQQHYMISLLNNMHLLLTVNKYIILYLNSLAISVAVSRCSCQASGNEGCLSWGRSGQTSSLTNIATEKT